MRSPSVRRALPLLELGGLLLVALLCLLFHLRLPGRLPSEADYRAAAERLQAEGQPGDAVLLFPWWAERARVYLEQPDGTRRDCPFDGKAHRCPGPAHLYVAPEWHEILYEPRRCLWMHAPGGKQRLVAELDGVPGGVGLRLEGGIIFEHAFPRDARFSTTHLGVDDAVSGARLVSLAIPPGLEGVQKAEVRLPDGAPHTVKIWVQADNADRRQVCLDVLGVEPEVGVRG